MGVVPAALGNKVIHPYSDFMLHDVGTGDGIAQTQHAQRPTRGIENPRRFPDSTWPAKGSPRPAPPPGGRRALGPTPRASREGP